MSLADAANAALTRTSKCLLMRLRDTMTADDVDTLDSWIDSDMSSYDMSKYLNAEGYRVSASTIRLHRTDKCACWGVS